MIPRCPAYRRGAGGRKHVEFRRASTHPFGGAKPLHKVAHRVDRWDSMVFNFHHLAACRQQFVEVPTPPGRVDALTVAAGRRPIERELNAATNSRRGFGFGTPNRLGHREHMVQRGIAHR